jgi:hypothetical protein
MDSVGMCVPTNQIRELSVFSIRTALRHNPSAQGIIAANDNAQLCKFYAKTMSSLNILSQYKKVFRLIICI